MITRRTFLSALIASPVISQVPAAKPITGWKSMPTRKLIPMSTPPDIARNIMLKSRQHGMTDMRMQALWQMANSGAPDEQIAKLTSVWLSDSDIPGAAKAIEDLREVKA